METQNSILEMQKKKAEIESKAKELEETVNAFALKSEATEAELIERQVCGRWGVVSLSFSSFVQPFFQKEKDALLREREALTAATQELASNLEVCACFDLLG